MYSSSLGGASNPPVWVGHPTAAGLSVLADSDTTSETVESQLEHTTGILLVDIPLGGRLAIIGSTNTLDKSTGFVGDSPNLLTNDTGKATDEVIHVY